MERPNLYEHGLGFFLLHFQPGGIYYIAACSYKKAARTQDSRLVVNIFLQEYSDGIGLKHKGRVSIPIDALENYVEFGWIPEEVSTALKDQIRQPEAYFKEIDLMRRGRVLMHSLPSGEMELNQPTGTWFR